MNGQYPNNNQNNQQQNYQQQPQQNYQQPQQNYQQPQQNPYQQNPYQQNPYQQPYQQMPVSNAGKGFSIAALVTGILGIIGSWIPFFGYVVLVCAILGIIFGVKGRQMSMQATGKASGLATAGLVLGIIGAAIAALGVICTTATCICADSILSSVGYYGGF